MLKRLFLWPLLLVAATDLAPAQVVSPTRPDQWEFSGFFGVASLEGASSFLSQVADGSANLVTLESEPGYLVGVRVTENLGKFFGAELEYSFANQPATFANLSAILPSFNLSQRVHTITYNGVVYLTPRGSKIRPYGTAGVGASLFQLTDDTDNRGVLEGLDLRDRWKLAVSWGGGVKVYSGRRWGFRLDFRDTVTGVPDYGIPRMSQVVNGLPTPAFRPDGLFHRLQFSGGFLFTFSGR